MSDQLAIVLIAIGWALAVGALGLAVAYLVRQRSVRWSLTLVSVVAVGAVVAGVIGTANAMFLSDHDFGVVLLVCVVAGAVAIMVALTVAAFVLRGFRALTAGARQLGDTGSYVADGSGPAEFRQLSAELSRASARLGAARERERQLELAPGTGRLGVSRSPQSARRAACHDRGTRGRDGGRSGSLPRSDAGRGGPHGAHGR